VPVHPPFSPGQIDRHLATVADSADLLPAKSQLALAAGLTTIAPREAA
jgi:hypothetical protein